jgi:hypothetical protein
MTIFNGKIHYFYGNEWETMMLQIRQLHRILHNRDMQEKDEICSHYMPLPIVYWNTTGVAAPAPRYLVAAAVLPSSDARRVKVIYGDL